MKRARRDSKRMWPRAFASGALVAGLVTFRAAGVELGVKGAQFTLDGTPAFLLGISYYGALGASRETIENDLARMQQAGFNWMRVWATWGAFENDVSAVDAQGRARDPYLATLKWLASECDRRGMVLDVTLTRGDATSGPGRVGSAAAHMRAVELLVRELAPRRNWYLDLANERNIADARFVDFPELAALRRRVRELDPRLLVTASQGGDIARGELRSYLKEVEVDFITPHRPRGADSPAQTEERTRSYLSRMRDEGRVVPVHYQEPFRRGYGPRVWEPPADGFLADLDAAIAGGAAGWCFHNGDQKDRPEGRPRRSFDLRDGALFDQLDAEERALCAELARRRAATE